MPSLKLRQTLPSVFLRKLRNTGVEQLVSGEHLTYTMIHTLAGIGKVVEKYSQLMADHISGVNVRLIDYKL